METLNFTVMQSAQTELEAAKPNFSAEANITSCNCACTYEQAAE